MCILYIVQDQGEKIKNAHFLNYLDTVNYVILNVIFRLAS